MAYNDIVVKANQRLADSKKTETIFASAARTTTTNSSDFESEGRSGIRMYLDITATAGTPTLDVKLQGKDPVSGSYFDISGAAFAQQTTTGTALLTVYPGIAETANESVSDVVPSTYRVVATIAGTTPSFTFSIGAEVIE